MTFTSHRWVATLPYGGPAFITLRARGKLAGTAADNFAAQARTLLQGWRTYMPTSVTWNPDVQVAYYNETDGTPDGVLGLGTVPGIVVGTGTGAYSAVAGFCAIWRTGKLHTRRLIVGRTFIVPSAGGYDTTNGRLLPATVTGIQTAGNTYVATPATGVDGHPVVWTRPSVKGATDGKMNDILSCTVNPSTAELKSRRQ